ncbi:hypothetical protein PBI_NEBKISS_139 [Mycobacterium phage Nebkiss]|nr:hypothetical protein PBI_NEBKISS_139 [Mycobacterium phage Nebkiss]
MTEREWQRPPSPEKIEQLRIEFEILKARYAPLARRGRMKNFWDTPTLG